MIDSKYTICLSCGRLIVTYYSCHFPGHELLSGNRDKGRCECGGKLTQCRNFDISMDARDILRQMKHKLPERLRAEEAYKKARDDLLGAEADLYAEMEKFNEHRKALKDLKETGCLPRGGKS